VQLPPDISQALYDALGENVQRPTVLVEFYENDVLPGINGFDPDTAILRIASISTDLNNTPVSFLGNAYTRYLAENPGDINRTITEKFNSINIILTNPEEPPNSGNRPMAAFILSNPIEGMFVVVRVVSRAFTAVTLVDSFVVFTGKLEKTFDVDTKNQTITLSAKQYIGSVDEQVPWRQFDPEDEEGTVATDPLFEGFIFSSRTGAVTFEQRVRRGGFLGLLGFKKTVTSTLQFTNHQGVEIEKFVPLVLGRAQVQFLPVAYIDAGTQINAIFCISEGPIKEIFDWRCLTNGFKFASDVDGNPDIDQFRYGYPGGTNGQVPFNNNLSGGIPANGYYSMSAMMSTAFYGTEVSQDDPAPEVIALILGMIIPMPDAAGDFTLEDCSDNPAFQTRWMLTHSRTFNLNPAFINDPQCVATACYCDGPVLDQTNGELILLPESDEPLYGVHFRRYHSTGLFTPEYWKHYFLGIGQDPLPELTLPLEADGLVRFFDPAAAPPVLDIKNLVRKRFTSNIYLTDKVKAVDFLFKVLLPSFRGYITQNARGKLDIKARRPGDNTLIRSAAVATNTEIAVNSILPWVSSLSGQVLVGVDLLTSELHTVTGTRYTSTANSITLAVTGNLTASGATLTGGDNDNPATGSVTITGLGDLTVTIDGHAVTYEPFTTDTTSTAAAQLTQHLKADLTLQPYLKFTWDKDTPTVIAIESKIGFLELDAPLAENHSIAEEVLRIQMAFSDRLFTPADLLKSNILRGSFRWPIGSRQSSVNRIDSTYTDSPQDFRAQPLRTRDADHVAQVKKRLPDELTLTAVDSFNQAKRLQASKLAELRDNDFFNQLSSDGRALLLEEGDLIVNTHASGGFRNVALRIEEVHVNLQDFDVVLVARRYATSAYGDVAPARNVPLPTTLSGASSFNTTGPPAIQFNTADFPPQGLIQTTDSEGITSIRGGMIFGASVFAQQAKVLLKRPGEVSFTQIDVKSPDGNLQAVFEFVASAEGTYTVRLEVCFVGGACNSTKPEAQITVGFGALGAMLTESAGLLLTEGGDFISTES
jgi:hypothetical protein